MDFTYTPANPDEYRPMPGTIAQEIRDQVARDLESLPPRKRAALVAGMDPDGARLALLVRAGDTFSFAGYLAHQWKGTTDYGARVVIAF